MKAYTHSKSFEILKSTKEAISGNLTSLQYLQTLDHFLWNALTPIQNECTSLFNNYFAKVVAQQVLKASTKFTSDDKSKLPLHLFNLLTSDNNKKANEIAKNMFLNRGLLFGFICIFLNNLRHFEKLHLPSYKIDENIRKVEISKVEFLYGTNHGKLYHVLREVRFWYDKAREFKEMIMQKYTRMALLQAQTTYRDYNHYIHLDDVIQIYLLVVNKAIDRCDARQGVLTTFIQNWFKSARSEVANLSKTQTDSSIDYMKEEYGDAIADIIGYVNHDNNIETIEHLSYIAKQEDPDGYIRVLLGIPEFLTHSQKKVLESFCLDC
jgi:hypothetical protein